MLANTGKPGSRHGLSELQKRILCYAETGPKGPGGGTKWISNIYRSVEANKVRDLIIPLKHDRWTESDKATVSRALRRLEMHGLIIRCRGSNNRRTSEIVLTPEGARVLGKTRAWRADSRTQLVGDSRP
jgi:hypothetical protein